MKIVIVGGGFAGLKLARRLNNKPGFEVVLLDRFNYHQFQPLFYQVATSSLDASNISFPLRKMFQKSKNLTIHMVQVQSLQSENKTVVTDQGNFTYDYLVLATGADTNFFGNKQLQENAFPMKSTTQALRIRYRLLSNFECAALTTDKDELKRLMTIVIAGGGPTGVELSGAIAEMKSFILPKDYPDIDFSFMKILLLEGLPKTLATMSEKSSDESKKYLEKLGVEVRVNTLVENYDGKVVTLKDGTTIPSALVVWAAGIKGNVPEGIDKELIVKGNRIIVDRYSKVKGFDNIFAVGDVAYMETPKYPKGHPQVANVAINQADNVAENFIRTERKSNGLYEFEYHDKGSLATVGRNKAVVDIPAPKIHLKGFVAWFIWMALHLFLLVGIKNRLQVFINWMVHYFTKDQSLRLIFRNTYKERV